MPVAGSRLVRHVVVGEVTVRFVDAGPRTDSEGRPTQTVVLLHGTGGTCESHFAFLLPLLAARHRVLGIDFADLDSGRPLTTEDLAAQVDAVLDVALGEGQKVVLCGYSLGAVVAAAVAARQPERLSQLVLICGWPKTDKFQELRSDVWHGLVKEGSSALAEFATFCAFGAPYLAARTPVELEALVAAAAATSSAIGAHMDLNRRVDIEDALAAIDAPTLVIGATFDQMVPVRQTKLLWGGISDARYAELPTGHAVMVERPAQVFQLISSFLDEPDAHPAGHVLTFRRP